MTGDSFFPTSMVLVSRFDPATAHTYESGVKLAQREAPRLFDFLTAELLTQCARYMLGYQSADEVSQQLQEALIGRNGSTPCFSLRCPSGKDRRVFIGGPDSEGTPTAAGALELCWEPDPSDPGKLYQRIVLNVYSGGTPR